MLASAELWGDDGKTVLCSRFSEERRAVRGTLRKSPIVGTFFEKQKQYSVLGTQYSVNQNKGCGYPWSDGACSGVQAIPALTAIFASIYKGLRWFWVLGALLSNTPLKRQLNSRRRQATRLLQRRQSFLLRDWLQSGVPASPDDEWLSPSSEPDGRRTILDRRPPNPMQSRLQVFLAASWWFESCLSAFDGACLERRRQRDPLPDGIDIERGLDGICEAINLYSDARLPGTQGSRQHPNYTPSSHS